ncbi:MAG: RIP metalloprotease RseP [Betaproteobacteria bacterium]|nr:RIP metalloprotease RseP [Betaproteobacteria bacterium]
MSLLYTVVSFVVALGVLIVVHEYGHYLVARLCGVKVLRFSVGFGRPLAVWRAGRDRTEWAIAAVPFGGYVKMLDEREAPVAPADLPRAFNRQGVGRRFLIVLAGPVFNFAFAIAVYAGLFMYGLPEARPILAAPPAGTLAAAAGFRAGDTVRAIGGRPVATWQELRWRVLEAALQREPLPVEVSDARRRVATLVLDLRGLPELEADGDVLARIGLRLYRPPLAPILGQIVAGSPAAQAGLRSGDRVVAAGGRAVPTWEALVQAVRDRPGEPLRLTVERDGRTLELEVLPKAVEANGKRIGQIGAAPQLPASEADEIFVRVHYGPAAALAKAARKTYDIATFSLKVLGKMVIGEVSWRNLSGPVTIADFAGQSAQLGAVAYLSFLALISISLGVLNLLPIPLLDGGHLMYYAIEKIRGSPVPERVMEFGQRIGLALLLILMAFAFYNDINRLFSG